MKEIPKFSFKVRLTPKRSLITLVVASLLAFLTTKCGISEQDFLKYYNELRKLIKWDLPDSLIDEFDNQLNDQINRDSQLLDYKVKREVDMAIYNYERLTGDTGRVQIAKPRYSEKAPDGSKAQELLGGEMRICAPWVPDCPEENQK